MRLLCVCGRIIDLPSPKAGAKIHCPKCRAKLYIPTKQEDHDLIRWFCPCGQRLKARIRSAGRQVKCPGCRKPVTVPFMNSDDAFIDAKFLVEDSDAPTPLPPAESITEPSLRQERNEELGIVEAEIVDELDPTEPDPKPSRAFDFEDEPLELAPLPHEKPAAPPSRTTDEPISLEGFEIEGEGEDTNDGFELAPNASDNGLAEEPSGAAEAQP